MKIQCQNCGVEHEIAPPSWVVSSGRAFRFRCSSCGYSQSVHPSTLSDEVDGDEADGPGEPPELGAPTPSFPPPTPTPMEERPPDGTPTADPEPSEEAPEPPPTGPTPFDHDPLSSMDDATPSSGGGASAVFLKQNGQIYMVSDWDTLKRWIAESRVERHDLVSEGGVRWEPVGNRAELMTAFGGAAPAPSPFPFGGETPFGDGGGSFGWHDDDTEGVPTGLPPLPTDEIPASDARGFDALDARLRKMTPTPPPVARRAPPPARPSFLTPTPAPAHRMNPDDVETASPEPRSYAPPPPEAPQQMVIAPPALPDTVPPAPVRKPPAPALLPEDDPDITQKRVVLDASMRPKAYQLADEDTVKTQPIDPDDELDLDTIRHLDPPSHPDPYDEPIEPRRSNGAFYLALAVLGVGMALACFGVAYVASGGPTRPMPEPIPSLPRPVEPAPVAPVAAPVVPEDTDVAETDAPGPEGTPEPSEPVPVEPAPAQPAPAQPAPVPAQPTPPQPTPPQPTPPRPAPARPDPAPAPRPAAASVNSLIDQGWGLVDGNPAAAAKKFEAAVDAAPNNADANFGYGYALVKQGRKDAAKPFLCKAVARGSVDTRREASGTLAAAGLSCGG